MGPGKLTRVSVYYAKLGSRPYRVRVNGYSFHNPAGYTFRQFVEDFSEFVEYPPAGILFSIFSMMAGWNGRCLGMATTSNLYFEDPSLKPVDNKDKPTFEMSKDDPGVIAEIDKYYVFMNMHYKANEEEYLYTDMGDFVRRAKEVLRGGRPFVLVLKKKGESGGHAVSCYKLVEDLEGKKAFLGVYDNELEGETWPYALV